MRRVCVFCGSASGARPDYARVAEALGRAIAARGMGLVYGGGAVGLMGIVSKAAMEAGAPVTGIIPHGLVMREAGNHDLTDLHIVASMHERKAMMAEMSDGFLVLPGGFGTLEEAVEALTWLQLGIHSKPLVFIDTLGFWRKQMAVFDHMLAEGLLRPEIRPMAMIAPDPDAALDALDGFVPLDVPRWLLPGES